MRGYQKKVIYLKNTGSRDFEEAYFVVKRDADGGTASPHLMIEEANRIVRENFGVHHGRLYTLRWYILSFIIGAAFGVLITFLISLIKGMI